MGVLWRNNIDTVRLFGIQHGLEIMEGSCPRKSFCRFSHRRRIVVGKADDPGLGAATPGLLMKPAKIAKTNDCHGETHAKSASPERMASAIVRPIAVVPCCPSMSYERIFPEPKAMSTLRSIARAARSKASLCCRSPSHSSIIAADKIIAVGLAIPFPEMSGAEPWLGWKTPWSSPISAEGAKP